MCRRIPNTRVRYIKRGFNKARDQEQEEEELSARQGEGRSFTFLVRSSVSIPNWTNALDQVNIILIS